MGGRSRRRKSDWGDHRNSSRQCPSNKAHLMATLSSGGLLCSNENLPPGVKLLIQGQDLQLLLLNSKQIGIYFLNNIFQTFIHVSRQNYGSCFLGAI